MATARRIGDVAIAAIEANCVGTDAIGDVVCISADKSGGYYTVAKVDIDNNDIKKAIGKGIISTKISDTICVVQLGGLVEDIYTGLTPGSRLFVNTSARLSSTPPTLPITGYRIFHKFAYAIASNVISVAPEVPVRLLQE